MRISDWSSDVCSSDLAPRVGQHFGRELGARADADEVRVGNAPPQFIFRQRLGVQVDVGVAGIAERVDRGLADAFEQQHADVLAGVRGLLHRSEWSGDDPVCQQNGDVCCTAALDGVRRGWQALAAARSEEHTSELQSLMRISYAVFCLKKK